MRGLGLGLGVGGAIAVLIACAGPQRATPSDRQHKLDAMDLRLSEIRQWRHERGMGIEPSTRNLISARAETIRQAKNVCPSNHVVPRSCSEICILGDDICDNAEAICNLADELGKDDQEGQDRCASGKASCHEAKQRCCDCAATAATEETP